ncbi:MAG: hypothetical protein KJ050_04870 [Candidatus Omnitrophica bacterium]|nr:hypothetical protein [Candidatus Omnitrophota bacterium]
MLLEGQTENTFSTLARASGKPLEDGPCDLFRRIQKRDGRIVDFIPRKITDAIFKAAQSVGGKDYRRAETLTEYVILELANQFQEKTILLNIEQIQDCIERVLVEKGHYRTARAFITYRNERARRRALKGELLIPCELFDGTGSLQTVSVSTSQGDSIRWDREKIVKALVRETNLPYEEARKVSYAVELEIVHSKISHLTSPLIRELTNAKLLQMGYENERRLHARLGLPVYDVEQRLLGRDAARYPGTVESEILCQFALDRVLPLEVSEAHGIQDVHVHDLHLVHKPLELRCELDLPEIAPWYQPETTGATSADRAWSHFLASWENTESRLLGLAGKRLVWENTNASLAFHAQRYGIEPAQAVQQALAKVWRLAGQAEKTPAITWRLADTVAPRWRGKFIGTRQLSLLPEDEVDAANRSFLLEILRQAADTGPYWIACGMEFEVVLAARAGKPLDSLLLEALAECISRSVPLRILFQRASIVGEKEEHQPGGLLQTISLNFPRAAAIAGGKDEVLAEWLEDHLHRVVEAHQAKKALLANRLKAGALAPLQSPGKAAGQDIPFHLEQFVCGVGVWGLAEMTRLHLGESPAKSDAALKWLLKLMARIKLRMNELGDRHGLRLRFVSNRSRQVVDRLSQSLLEAGFDCDSQSCESLIDLDAEDSSTWVSEGKVHSFFPSGHAVLGLEALNRKDKTFIQEAIQMAAAETHLGGLTWVDEFCRCRQCSAVSGEIGAVCSVCGCEQMVLVDRQGQGMVNRITRL